MGTLELRITAVKPGVDGKLVGVICVINDIGEQQSHICTHCFHCVFDDSLSRDLSCAVQVTSFTSEHVQTPALPS